MLVSPLRRTWILLLLLLTACTESPPQTQLERIRSDGVLRVLTRNSPTTYYIGADGPGGMEYELARGFAESLGVKLEMVVPVGAGDIPPMLRHGRADLAAAGLAITERRSRTLRFGPSYLQVRQQLAYRPGTTKPASLDDLDGRLGVVARSAQEQRLEALSETIPALQWTAYAEKTQQELLEMVANGQLDYAVANSNEISHARRYYADVAVALDISDALDVAWAFTRQSDKSLYLAVREYFQTLRDDGTLTDLRKRFYDHFEQYDYVDARTFLKRIAERLPEYRAHFRSAAAEQGFDWRLLAAVSYQESHWDADALSPTGVRGMMMLTQDTAARVGIEDRTDPVQSIHGGARYLREVVDKIPERIPHPDRLWFALAAYNIGFGHVEDARILTESQGGDPDSWEAVRERLPLLSQEQWYKKTRLGYARGYEPIRFVRNIRRYYNVLVWLDSHNQQALKPVMPQIHPPVL